MYRLFLSKSKVKFQELPPVCSRKLHSKASVRPVSSSGQPSPNRRRKTKLKKSRPSQCHFAPSVSALAATITRAERNFCCRVPNVALAFTQRVLKCSRKRLCDVWSTPGNVLNVKRAENVASSSPETLGPLVALVASIVIKPG